MSETRTINWRQVLDRLDDALHDAEALADPAIFAARRELGRAIGLFVVSAEEGKRVTVSARTYPPYGDNGAMHEPGVAKGRWGDATREPTR